jgi:hypothetical protein
MSEPSGTTPARPRDGWVSLGMAVSATAAAVSSFSGLFELAVAAGWAPVMAPLLPLTIDAFAATATRIWLSGAAASNRARRFARICAVSAIALSLAGNATWHLVAAQLVSVNWMVVLAVGAVPPCVLGLVSHLAVLRTQTDDVVPDAVAGTVPKVQVDTTSGTNDELLTAARIADAAYRARYGRPISRDALRKELRVSAARASDVLRRLRNTPDPTQGGRHS